MSAIPSLSSAPRKESLLDYALKNPEQLVSDMGRLYELTGLRNIGCSKKRDTITATATSDEVELTLKIAPARKNISLDLDGSLTIRRTITIEPTGLILKSQLTDFSRDGCGQGLGSRSFQNELQWIKSWSCAGDQACLKTFATRLSGSTKEAPGQFVWRNYFDFDPKLEAKNSKQTRNEYYQSWLSKHVTEAQKQKFPQTIDHPWSLNQDYLKDIEPDVLAKFDQKAKDDGYPGTDTFAWCFWNSDLVNGESEDEYDDAINTILSWSGVRCVNQPWVGPAKGDLTQVTEAPIQPPPAHPSKRRKAEDE